MGKRHSRRLAVCSLIGIETGNRGADRHRPKRGLPKKPVAESGWERTCASTRVATRRAEDISHIRQSRNGARPSPILTVVVPTFNESANVPVLVERVAAALDGIEWELVFVDDNSPDATSAVAKELGRRDSRVRCIRRVRPARPFRRLPRGRAFQPGRVRRGDGRRSPARRAALVGDAKRAPARQSRPCDRKPLCERRRGKWIFGAAPIDQPRRYPVGTPPHRDRRTRPHERLLHDAPRPPRPDCAGTVERGLQDPVRHSHHGRTAEALNRGDPVRLSRAAQREQQVRSAYRARVRRARSCEANASGRPAAISSASSPSEARASWCSSSASAKD